MTEPRTQLSRIAVSLILLPLSMATTQAAEQPFEPPGGLPIVVNAGAPQAQLDIDGDMEADFLIYRDTTFGNGFAIFGYTTSNNVEQNLIRGYVVNTDPPRDYKLVVRYDSTEIVSNAGNDTAPALFIQGQETPGNTSMFIDFTADSSARTFVPFRDNPGFISLRFGTNVMGDPEESGLAWIEVVVAPDGSELQVLSGAWDDNRGNRQLVLP